MRPVLVLGGRVVEGLGGHDEAGQEHAVLGACHAAGQRREARAQAAQVDEGGHEGGCLDVGAADQVVDERFERRQGVVVGVGGVVAGAAGGRGLLGDGG